MEEFKNKHKGQTFVIFGSGPTLLEWDDSYCPGAIKVGCNTVFMHKPDLDYYFIQDNGYVTQSENGYYKYKEKYDNYQPSIAKFYGVSYFPNGLMHAHSMMEWDIVRGGAKRYLLGEDFTEFYSVIFSCLQFARLCGAGKIIMVGCDVTNNIRAGEENEHNGYKVTNLIYRWGRFKESFPDLDIEVFKPVGLKHLFEEYKV